MEASGAQVLKIEGDVRCSDIWDIEFDVLYHLAAVTPRKFQADPATGLAVNALGTLRALEACRSRGAQLVFVSTCGVYSPVPGGGVGEEDATGPRTPYATSKLLAEMLCQFYSNHYSVPTVVARLFNVYGEGQNSEFLIPYLVHCAVEGQEAVLHHPESARDFVHVSDVVAALASLAWKTAQYRVFNIGSGHPHTIRQVIDTLEVISGKPLAWTHCSAEADLYPLLYARIGRASEELGWRPEKDLESGLRALLEAETSRRSGGPRLA